MSQFRTNYRLFEARAKRAEEIIANLPQRAQVVLGKSVEYSKEIAQKGDFKNAHDLLETISVYVK